MADVGQKIVVVDGGPRVLLTPLQGRRGSSKQSVGDVGVIEVDAWICCRNSHLGAIYGHVLYNMHVSHFKGGVRAELKILTRVTVEILRCLRTDETIHDN